MFVIVCCSLLLSQFPALFVVARCIFDVLASIAYCFSNSCHPLLYSFHSSLNQTFQVHQIDHPAPTTHCLEKREMSQQKQMECSGRQAEACPSLRHSSPAYVSTGWTSLLWQMRMSSCWYGNESLKVTTISRDDNLVAENERPLPMETMMEHLHRWDLWLCFIQAFLNEKFALFRKANRILLNCQGQLQLDEFYEEFFDCKLLHFNRT